MSDIYCDVTFITIRYFVVMFLYRNASKMKICACIFTKSVNLTRRQNFSEEKKYVLENLESESKFAVKLNAEYGYIEYTKEGNDYDLRHVTVPKAYLDKGHRKTISNLAFNYILVEQKANLKITSETISGYFQEYKKNLPDKHVEEDHPDLFKKEVKPVEKLKEEKLKLVNHEDRHVFIARFNKQTAFLQYKKVDNVYNILYIMVPSLYRGSGLGTKFVLNVFDYIEKENARMIISCGFVKKVFKNHEARYIHIMQNPKGSGYIPIISIKIKKKKKKNGKNNNHNNNDKNNDKKEEKTEENK